jgi:hypothetical protein
MLIINFCLLSSRKALCRWSALSHYLQHEYSSTSLGGLLRPCPIDKAISILLSLEAVLQSALDNQSYHFPPCLTLLLLFIFLCSMLKRFSPEGKFDHIQKKETLLRIGYCLSTRHRKFLLCITLSWWESRWVLASDLRQGQVGRLEKEKTGIESFFCKGPVGGDCRLCGQVTWQPLTVARVAWKQLSVHQWGLWKWFLKINFHS